MVDAQRRTRRRHTRLRPLAVATAAAVLLAACGNDDVAEQEAADTDDVEEEVGDPDEEAEEPAEDDDDAAADPQSCDDVDLSDPPDEPLEIRFGHGIDASEPFLIQFVDPEVAGAEHYGTWYEMDATEYSPQDRLADYQAGGLDAGTISYPQLSTAIESGLDLRAVATLNIIDEEEEYRYPYLTMADSEYDDIADLEGATISYIAPNTTTEYWVISALVDAGVDPDSVEYVSLPPPAAEEALRSGQVDVAFVPNSFLQPLLESGDFEILFDAYTATGFSHPNLDIFWDEPFLRDNVEAYCAWLSDYVNSIEAFVERPEEVGEALIEAQYDPAPDGEAFAQRPHSGVREDGTISLEDLQMLLDDMVEIGFLDSVDVTAEDIVIEGWSLVAE